jgi:hypothetical protein
MCLPRPVRFWASKVLADNAARANTEDINFFMFTAISCNIQKRLQIDRWAISILSEYCQLFYSFSELSAGLVIAMRGLRGITKLIPLPSQNVRSWRQVRAGDR